MTTKSQARTLSESAAPKTTDTFTHTDTSSRIKTLIVLLAVWGLMPAGFATWLTQRGWQSGGRR